MQWDEDQDWSEEELAAFKVRITNGNLENDPGFGYFGDKHGPKWGTLPIGMDATRESDYVSVSNWGVIKRDLAGDFPEHAVEEPYRHWVGSIQFSVMRIDTEHEPTLRRALSIVEAYEQYPILDEDHASNTEMELLEEAYNQDPSLPTMIEEWVRVNHRGELQQFGLTPARFVELHGQRLAEDAMRGNGELYVDEDNIGDGWADILYEIRWDYEQSQPQLPTE